MENQDNGYEHAGLVITNLIKLGGFIAAMNELLLRESSDPKRYALIALMLAGVQGVENFLKGVLGK